MTSPSGTRNFIKKLLPKSLWRAIRGVLMMILKWLLQVFGLVATKRNDFNSPLPDVEALRTNRLRWDRPSALKGVTYNLDEMKSVIEGLTNNFGDELKTCLPSYDALQKLSLGWGMPYMDLQVLYLMVRSTRPARYIEIGSGASTYVAALAASKNATEGHPCAITCIEPYPNKSLTELKDIRLIIQEVQSVDPAMFDILTESDILFIDSSHIAKIDSDVPFLFLEVLPRLQRGVTVHVHDTPFPHNTPYPADFWIFSDTVPPMFWNEAMLMQAFLCHNDCFQIKLSTPLLRYHDEPFLKTKFSGYQEVLVQPNTFSSLWMKRVK
jgi:Methyltransferase domain